MTFKEDTTRMTKAAVGRIVGTIHNLVLALIKRASYSNTAKARRWFADHLDQAFVLLTTNQARL